MSRSLGLCLALLGCSEYGLNGQPPVAELEPDPVEAPPPVEEPAPNEEPPAPPPPPPPLEEEPPPVLDAYTTEVWEIPDDQPVDVVIFGDTSGSMSDELDELGGHITSFTDRLVADGVNWRLMAVNGDQGCGVDGWFDANTPNWQTRFANALLEEPNSGSTNERGLVTTALAIEATAPGGCNASFLRPDALLHVIYVSDENDESPGYQNNGTSTYWQQYVDRIVAAKGSADLVTLSAVAGDTPNGCNGADPGWGYAGAVAATGGAFVSICGPWSDELDTLAGVVSARDTYPLAGVPAHGTLSVWIDGVEAPASTWVWDETENAVVFIVLPPAGSELEFRYVEA